MRKSLFAGAAITALMMLGLAPNVAAQEGDPPGDATTTARLQDSVDGEISPAADADWYRLGVERGMRYSLALVGLPNAEGQTVDPVLAVYDANGNQLVYNDDANNSLNSALRYIAQESGEVFVEARAYSSEATGAYRLGVAVDAAPEDAIGADSSTRGRVTPGRATAGELEYEGDIDWHRMRVRTGTRYSIALAGAGETALGDPVLRVLDPDGTELAANDDADGLNSALEFIPQANGDVFIEARAYADAYTGGYEINVAAERLPRDATPGDSTSRSALRFGDTVNAALDFTSDRDWYRVRLEAGQAYRFTLRSDGEQPLSDPLLRLLDSDGRELAMDDDGGGELNSYLEFVAPSAGVYFVEARGYGDDATGGYALTAQTGDIPADASTDASLSADGDYREGMLAPSGDRDWYRVDLDEGQSVRVALNSAGAADALGDPYLSIYGPDGAMVASDDDSGGEGLNAWLEYQATATGPHFVEVRGFSDDASGRYVMGLMSGEIGASPDAAEYLSPNGMGRASFINADGDVDWFAVEMIEARPYRFNLDAEGENALADPYLRLFDANGLEVAADDDGGPGVNSYLSFASPTGGTYFAAVSSYGDTGAGRYRLRVTDTEVPGHVYTDENLDAGSDERISRIDVVGDVDIYRAALEAGATYEITIVRHGEHGLANPQVELIGGDEARLAEGRNGRLRFTPENAGEYYIRASGVGGAVGDYRVRIVRQ